MIFSHWPLGPLANTKIRAKVCAGPNWGPSCSEQQLNKETIWIIISEFIWLHVVAVVGSYFVHLVTRFHRKLNLLSRKCSFTLGAKQNQTHCYLNQIDMQHHMLLSNGPLPLEDGFDWRETLSKRVSGGSQRFIFRRRKNWNLKLFANFDRPFTPWGWLRLAWNLTKTRFRCSPTYHVSTSKTKKF